MRKRLDEWRGLHESWAPARQSVKVFDGGTDPNGKGVREEGHVSHKEIPGFWVSHCRELCTKEVQQDNGQRYLARRQVYLKVIWITADKHRPTNLHNTARKPTAS